jgi:hypothetical protein
MFADWCKDWWERRKLAEHEGRHADAAMCKAVLCGLYGRFARWSQSWQPSEIPNCGVIWGEWAYVDLFQRKVTQLRSMNGKVEQRSKPGERDDTLVAISAYVASYLRVRMRQLMDIAGPREWLYSATDSIHVTDDGYDRIRLAGLICDGTLGALRDQHHWDWCVYHGPRDYQSPKGLSCAGVPSCNEPLGSNSYRFDVQESTNGALNRPLDGKTRQVRRVITKVRPQPCGEVDREGWVWPYRLPRVVDDRR